MKETATISPELQQFIVAQKITSLNDLLLIDDETLLGMDGFGWRMLKEVLRLRQTK